MHNAKLLTMNENLPKISIITVTYNAASTLEDTILSVVNQSYPNIEYIIIDGGSTDGTVDIIRKYSNKISYWISEPDNGVYDAMNKATKVATGDFCFFLGADDILLVDLTTIEFKKHLGNIIYGNVQWGNTEKTFNGKYTKGKLLLVNICHQAIFYPSVAYKNHSYNTTFKAYADWDLNMRLWGAGYIFHYIPCIISHFNFGGISGNGDAVFENARIRLIYDYFGIKSVLYYIVRSRLGKIKRLILKN
jgi:glycosyltransferase involved in cell wall biosynthesis